MALNNIFNALKKEGIVIRDLDLYLTKIANDSDGNRAVNINAPSQVGKCMRSRYYARTGEESDPNSITARAQRIFDNGTGVHERLQKYLKDIGILIMDELPVLNIPLNIQGHTDGVLKLSTCKDDENFASKIAVLEIKSINSHGFSQLKTAKEEHKMQGLVYLYCLETHRLELKKSYPTLSKFLLSSDKRKKRYRERYEYLSDGSHFTREEKIQYQVDLNMYTDSILYHLEEPITEVVFLYENKDTQDLKEFVVSSNDKDSKVKIESIVKDYAKLNDLVATHTLPPREDTKNGPMCRWCNYKIACWN